MDDTARTRYPRRPKGPLTADAEPMRPIWSILTSALAACCIVFVPTSAEAGCADLPTLVHSAQADFDDAEVDRAAASIDAAYESLSCQPVVIPTADLLGLYRLDALVSLAQGDRKSAQYAVIRAVVVDPQAAPPEIYGPELIDLHESWRARLQDSKATLRIVGGGRVWVDGRPVSRGSGNTVVQGEHLLQFKGGAGWTSEVRDVGTDTRIETGIPESDDDVEEPTEKPKKKHKNPALLVSGLAVAAVGGGSIGFGFQQEQLFKANPYRDTYFGCDRASACYEDARTQQIRQDAHRINAFYGVGYGLVAAGAGLVLLDLILPTPVSAVPLPGGGMVLGTVAF